MAEMLGITAVSTHSRLKAAGGWEHRLYRFLNVSTHSRLKAAGRLFNNKLAIRIRFNTQPPEGGWGPS